jgi:undecaprenyl-diphosphatase
MAALLARWGPLVLFGVCLVSFLGLAIHASQQQVTSIDRTTQTIVRGQATLDARLMRGLTALGSGYVLVPMNVVVFLILFPVRPKAAIAIPLITAGATIFEACTKWMVGRPRPNLAAFGFPSGHVLASVAFFGALTYLLWVLDDRRVYRWAGSAFFAVAVAGIALSRLYLNAHWLSDVLGSLTGGTAYLLASLLVIDRSVRSESAASDAPEAPEATPFPSSGAR